MQDIQASKITHTQARVQLAHIIARTDDIPVEDVSGQSTMSHDAFKTFHEYMGKPAGKYWFSSMPASKLLAQFEFEPESA